MPIYALGLLGWPLGHSLSPRLHNAALDAAGLAGCYRLYPVPLLPGGAEDLRGWLEAMRRGELHGLNITIPHKQAVLPLLDELTPAARAIGAVNTVFWHNGRLAGDNTDAPGFWADLEQQAGLLGQPLAGLGLALVLGAGGAARAVVYALLQHGWQVVVCARRETQALTLVQDLQLSTPGGRLSAFSFERLAASDQLSALESHPVLIVNTTPLGMAPDVDSSPWPAGWRFPTGAAVYDLVYNPVNTMLVQAARRAGLPAVGGLGMLVEQAALSFERWTGVLAPRQAMRAAL